jgi:putative ABC transport system substrate-binding protein
MKRWKLITLIGGLAIASPLTSFAKQPNPAPQKRVGILTQQVRCPIQTNTPITLRLAELGWIEGRNFVFDCVSTVDRLDQLPALARELVSRSPDVIMAGPSTFVLALKQETATIPIVMYGAWEPVRLGIITNEAPPQTDEVYRHSISRG